MLAFFCRRFAAAEKQNLAPYRAQAHGEILCGVGPSLDQMTFEIFHISKVIWRGMLCMAAFLPGVAGACIVFGIQDPAKEQPYNLP